MFERYTERARRVIFFARYEAAQFGSSSIETEHLLLGLLREDEGLAVRFLGPGIGRGAAETVPPADVEASRQRIDSLQKQMENAIANQQFEKARDCAELQRLERERLRQLHKPVGASADFIEDPVACIRRRIEANAEPRSKVSTRADLPLTHGSKRVLGYAAEECERLKHRHIAPEHLFLGLMREEKCLAADLLHERGLRLSEVREEIARSGPAETDGPRPGLAGSVGFNPRPAPLAGSVLPGRQGWMSALGHSTRILHLARHEAVERRKACIETVDLLLALTHEKEVIERFLIPVEAVRRHANATPAAPGEKVSAEELPFSEDFKLACTFAVQEAAHLGQPAGLGHLLLGLLRVESCAAAQTLRDCGISAAGIRALHAPPPSSDLEQGRSYV